MERREIYFSGAVQGVGFRYTTQAVARQYAVTGYVQNLADGRVRLVAEGEKEEVGRFAAAVEQEMAGSIHRTEVQRLSATGEFERFQIRM